MFVLVKKKTEEETKRSRQRGGVGDEEEEKDYDVGGLVLHGHNSVADEENKEAGKE